MERETEREKETYRQTGRRVMKVEEKNRKRGQKIRVKGETRQDKTRKDKTEGHAQSLNREKRET